MTNQGQHRTDVGKIWPVPVLVVGPPENDPTVAHRSILEQFLSRGGRPTASVARRDMAAELGLPIPSRLSHGISQDLIIPHPNVGNSGAEAAPEERNSPRRAGGTDLRPRFQALRQRFTSLLFPCLLDVKRNER